MEERSLEEYVELGELARKLVAYKYRVFTAASQLGVGLSITIPYLVWQTIAFGVGEEAFEHPLAPLICFLSFFLPAYFVAATIWRMYAETARILQASQGKAYHWKYAKLIPAFYGGSICLMYLLQPPLPHWEVYAWLAGLTLAQALHSILEVKLSRFAPEYSTVSHRVSTVLCAVATVGVIVLDVTLGSQFLCTQTAMISALTAYLVSALIELRRAEKLA